MAHDDTNHTDGPDGDHDAHADHDSHDQGHAHDDQGHAHDGQGHAHDGQGHAHDGQGHAHDHDHAHDHAHHGGDLETVGYGVLTVSSTREFADDASGDAIESVIESTGGEVVARELVGDDLDSIQSSVARLVEESDVDCLVTTGGTGPTPDDVTVEAIEPLFDKELPGFGELFRSLSREEIGTRVIATRATAGVANGVPVFALPGSENAARLGVERLVTAEAAHLAALARE